MKDKGEESSERQRGERGRRQGRAMELSGGGGKKSGRENENIPEIFFVRKIHEGFCSITMQAPLLLLLKSLNEDKREPKSL